MVWGQVAAAGLGALGGALGGNQENIGPGDLVPNWLKQDWQNLGGQIAGLQTPEYYQGDLIAQQNPWLAQALGGMAGFGQPGGVGGDIASQLTAAGGGLLPAAQQGMDYLGQMQDRGPAQFQFDQGTYDQIMGNLTGGMQDVFDVGARGMQQDFMFNQLPGLKMADALGGGGGDTRAYQQGALAQAMTNRAIQEFGTDLWQNAANQALGGALGASAQNLAAQQGFDSSILGGYGQFGQMGAQLLDQGFDASRAGLGLGLQAGQLQQGYDQSLIDADMQRWNFEQQAPWTALNTQLNMINAQKMGQAPYSTGISPWEGLLQGAQTGLGLYSAGQDAGWWGGGGDNSDAIDAMLRGWGAA